MIHKDVIGELMSKIEIWELDKKELMNKKETLIRKSSEKITQKKKWELIKPAIPHVNWWYAAMHA